MHLESTGYDAVPEKTAGLRETLIGKGHFRYFNTERVVKYVMGEARDQEETTKKEVSRTTLVARDYCIAHVGLNIANTVYGTLFHFTQTRSYNNNNNNNNNNIN